MYKTVGVPNRRGYKQQDHLILASYMIKVIKNMYLLCGSVCAYVEQKILSQVPK
jgi:hypothetical protein